MSRNLISVSRGTSTMGIVRTQLDRIETETGYRPEDWLYTMSDEAYDEFFGPDGFDWEAFEMHIACLADSFIEFIEEHYQHLHMSL